MVIFLGKIAILASVNATTTTRIIAYSGGLRETKILLSDSLWKKEGYVFFIVC